MDQELLSLKFECPKWRRLPSRWIEVIAFVLGILFTFFYSDFPWNRQARYVVGISLMTVPISVPTFVWLWKASQVVRQRVRYYPRLHERARQQANELVQAREIIYTLAQNIGHREFEMTGVRYDQGKLYIELKKRRGHQLVLGDALLVVHTDDERPMGEFEVTDVRSDRYYAVGTSNLDRLWLGYMKQEREIRILPSMVAFHIPTGEES